MKKTSIVYLKRIERLQKALTRDAFLIEDPLDLQYLTGIKLSTGQLLVKKRSAHLFVDGRYTEAAKKHSPVPVKPHGLDQIKKLLPAKSTLEFDKNKTSYGRYLNLKSELKRHVKPGISYVSDLRIIKDKQELTALKKSARLLWKGYTYARKQLKTGITELEMVRLFETFVKANGAEALSFDPIIAFGANTAMPHYHPGNSKLKKNDIVLMDMGVVVDGYCSDMTRTFFYGTPIKKLEPILKATQDAQRASLDLCKAGTLIKDLDGSARKSMGPLKKHFVHSLGHGIGLEVHEEPRLASKGAFADKKLEEGMVITIEPGIYIPKLGGVRIEDTVVVTKTGYENITEY